MAVILVVPPGALGYPISHDDRQFQPYPETPGESASRWLVAVPEDAAVGLISRGGFFPMSDNPAGAEDGGSVVLRHDDPNAVPGAGERLDDGSWRVPAAMAAMLAAHGFVPVGEGEAASRDPRDARIAELEAENAALRDDAPAPKARAKS